MFRHSIRLVHGAVFDVFSSVVDDDSPEPGLFIKVGDDMFLSVKPEYSDYQRRCVGPEHVQFVRELVEASKQYLAELERAYEHDQALEDQANDDQEAA